MIKNLVLKLTFKWFKRGELFIWMFCPTEQVAIINALYRRSEDNSETTGLYPYDIKSECAKLAKELSEAQ